MKKPKRGRPPLPKGQARTRMQNVTLTDGEPRIGVRLTESLAGKVARLARERKPPITASALIRECVQVVVESWETLGGGR